MHGSDPRDGSGGGASIPAVACPVVAGVAVIAVVAGVVVALGERLDRTVDKNYLKPQHYS